MPSKFVIRDFTEDSAYHVYNRGVDKRTIFLNDQDHEIFLYYLFVYVSPIKIVLRKYPHLPIRLEIKNLSTELKIYGYCLMPNHFHLLLYQKSIDAIPRLLKQVSNAYTRYFNNKYERVGSLFQGRYKAASINNDELLAHIIRYIHLNPIAAKMVSKPDYYPWSSYHQYTGDSKHKFCSTKEMLSLFASKEDFCNFTFDQTDYKDKFRLISKVAIDQ